MRLLRPATVALILAGCAASSSASRELLVEADRLVERGNYQEALEVYDALLQRFPRDRSAWRARASRDTVAGLLETRQELTRVREETTAAERELGRLRDDVRAREGELARLRTELIAREVDLARLRQELAARQAELARFASETEQLRLDLEKLKNLDLRLERRR
jgi:tetratricopeptide (TPR) repeat protein